MNQLRFPSEMSVRMARDIYLGENGFSTDQYDADRVTVNFWGIRFPVPNPPSRKLAVRYHDLHHVITGYGTDPQGESEISAWECRRGMGVFSWYVQSIILTGFLTGFIHSPKAVYRAWKRAHSSHRLPPPSLEGYAELLELTVGELRHRYEVPPEGFTQSGKLHLDAPRAPSKS